MSKYELQIGGCTLRNEVSDVVVRQDRIDHGFETMADIVLRLGAELDPARLNLYWPVIVDQFLGRDRKRILYGVVTGLYTLDEGLVKGPNGTIRNT